MPAVRSTMTGVRSTMPAFRRLFEWDPLEWSIVERCQLVAVLMFLFGLSYWAMEEYFVLEPELAPYYDRGFLKGFQNALLCFVALWVLVYTAGLRLKKTRPDSRVL